MSKVYGEGERKRVMFIVRQLSLGGAERVTAVLASGFSDNQIDTHLVELDARSEDYKLSGNVHRHLAPACSIWAFRMAIQMMYLQHLIYTLRPDCIVALGSICLKASHLFLPPGTKLILSERNYPNSYSRKQFSSFSRAYQKADCVVFQTHDAMKCYGVDIQHKGLVIPNPVKSVLPRFTWARKLEAVTFARLEPQKNLALLIDAFAIFHNEHKDWHLSIYGQGSLHDELERHIASMGLVDSITILPFASDIHDRVKDAGMFISSSDYEGLQNALIEAMAMGIPCIATDSLGGGAREITADGSRGILVQRGNVKEMAEAMCKLADDEALAKRLSLAGSHITDEWSERSVVASWIKLIDGAL